MSCACWVQLDSSGLGEAHACVWTQLLGGQETDCAKLTSTGWRVLLPLASDLPAGWPGLVIWPSQASKRNRAEAFKVSRGLGSEMHGVRFCLCCVVWPKQVTWPAQSHEAEKAIPPLGGKNGNVVLPRQRKGNIYGHFFFQTINHGIWSKGPQKRLGLERTESPN